MEDKNKNEIAKSALKALVDLEEKTNLETLVKDNVIRFVINKQEYRLRRPTQADQEDANAYRGNEYLKLMNDDNALFKEQWIERYKKKGIDIKKMEAKVREYNQQIKDLLMKLATAKTPKNIEILKKEIEALKEKQFEISIKLTDLLSYSIEDQLNIRTTTYLCYLVLEKKEKDKWVKAYKDLQLFKTETDARITNQALYFINYLIYNA
jgi:hypothetical protein